MARKRTQRLATAVAVARLDSMFKPLQDDVQMALEVFAALEAVNDLIQREFSGVKMIGHEVVKTIKRTFALNLALQIAKLFEVPTRKGQSQAAVMNRSDVCSLPVALRLLGQKRCQKVLEGRARNWGGAPRPQIADRYERECSDAMRRGHERYRRFVTTPEGRRVMRALKSFRNAILAHRLLVEAEVTAPTYRELFAVVGLARDLWGDLSLAMRGQDRDMLTIVAFRKRLSTDWWRLALRGVEAGSVAYASGDFEAFKAARK